MKRMRDRKKLPTSVTLLTHKRKSNRNRIRTNEQTPKKESRADHRYIEQYRFGVKSEIPKYRCEIRKAQIKGRDRTECRARAHTHTHIHAHRIGMWQTKGHPTPTTRNISLEKHWCLVPWMCVLFVV